MLNWAEEEETENIDVDAQAANNIRDASDLSSRCSLREKACKSCTTPTFLEVKAWLRLGKRYSPTTPVRGLQLMMSVSPQKISKGNTVPEMIDRGDENTCS